MKCDSSCVYMTEQRNYNPLDERIIDQMSILEHAGGIDAFCF